MLRLVFIFLLMALVCPVIGQQIIKAQSKSAHFNIVPVKDTATTTGISITTNLQFYEHEKKTALVIGNGNYTNGPLKNAVNDALDMAATLSGKGFKVILKQNASRADMREAIREFGTEINEGGVGLFYYSGHGIQVDGVNYLVPIDANVEMKAEVAEECINASTILRVMEYSNNRINVIILDACRNNPFRSFSRSDEKGITKMDPPKGAKQGSIIAFATAPGDVASDGEGRNGLYTSKLLKYMNTPELTLEEVFKKVRIEVSTESAGRQIPWENNSLTGDFFFTIK
ncbi:caspase family protein [Ohtaekwangia koreensis]|uniref:Caspase domain-containing protein n=1 Tax=Ohtaekwangia koreensis TaxID=688867 RepID=A0A1T5IIZ9_9BACT|nr:caspase family protein [Ohtaekwangia koreensis]SKC39125.1 Caspase domain-containing protein [Ohtaekwangia koreensis]